MEITTHRGRKYGLMPEHDGRTIERMIDYVIDFFPTDYDLHCLEIGVHAGDTSRAMMSYVLGKQRSFSYTGIDNQRDFKMGKPFPGAKFIVGNSIEVYNQVKDESQHFAFLDGCHNLAYTMADFLLYGAKIKRMGFLAFHDCSPHIPAMKDYQGSGPKADPDMYIACRKAVTRMGLLNGKCPGWVLVMDEYDPAHDTGGIVVVQKIGVGYDRV